MWNQVGLHIPLDFIFQTKLVEVMEFQLNNFKDQKMILWKCCTQYVNKFGKLSSGHRTRKGSVFIPIPKKGNAKECSNYHTIALFSHASKVILKILQVRLQQHVNHGIPDVQAGFRKGRGTRDQIVNICWQHLLDQQKSKRVPEKHLLQFYWLCQRLWLRGSQQTGKLFMIWVYQTTLPASWEICIQVKKHQLELDMDEWTGFR